MSLLESVFEGLCRYLDGKLRWHDRRAVWTESVMRFFTEFRSSQDIRYIEDREHLGIDYIWRYPKAYPTDDIVLAVEHEVSQRDVNILLYKEVRRLIDIKAMNKVGIFYIKEDDEEYFKREIREMIKRSSPYDLERYLIILGYAAEESGRPAILFKGLFFDHEGRLYKEVKLAILQREENLLS